jgi:hypothetical protein
MHRPIARHRPAIASATGDMWMYDSGASVKSTFIHIDDTPKADEIRRSVSAPPSPSRSPDALPEKVVVAHRGASIAASSCEGSGEVPVSPVASTAALSSEGSTVSSAAASAEPVQELMASATEDSSVSSAAAFEERVKKLNVVQPGEHCQHHLKPCRFNARPKGCQKPDNECSCCHQCRCRDFTKHERKKHNEMQQQNLTTKSASAA